MFAVQHLCSIKQLVIKDTEKPVFSAYKISLSHWILFCVALYALLGNTFICLNSGDQFSPTAT